MKPFSVEKLPEDFGRMKDTETKSFYEAVGKLTPGGKQVVFRGLSRKEVERYRGLVVGGGKNSSQFKKVLAMFRANNWKPYTVSDKDEKGTYTLGIGVKIKGGGEY